MVTLIERQGMKIVAVLLGLRVDGGALLYLLIAKIHYVISVT